MEAQIPTSFDELEERVENEERTIRRNLKILFKRYPEVRKDQGLVRPINAAIDRIRSLMAGGVETGGELRRRPHSTDEPGGRWADGRDRGPRVETGPLRTPCEQLRMRTVMTWTPNWLAYCRP